MTDMLINIGACVLLGFMVGLVGFMFHEIAKRDQ